MKNNEKHHLMVLLSCIFYKLDNYERYCAVGRTGQSFLGRRSINLLTPKKLFKNNTKFSYSDKCLDNFVRSNKVSLNNKDLYRHFKDIYKT